jgi:hypothetical protein
MIWHSSTNYPSKRASRARIIMLALLSMFLKADEVDSGCIEARLDETGNEEFRRECAVDSDEVATKT